MASCGVLQTVVGEMVPFLEIPKVVAMKICLALEGNCKIGLLQVTKAEPMPKPFQQIKNEERHIEPFELLLAMYQLVVEHMAVNVFTSSCENEAKECDGDDVAIWHKARLDHFCPYRHGQSLKARFFCQWGTQPFP